MLEFFQTRLGHKFYEADVPRLITAMERIANALEKAEARAAAITEKDELEEGDRCPKCMTDNVANEGPPENGQIEVTCHDCSHQFVILI
jgi:transposase-like protein